MEEALMAGPRGRARLEEASERLTRRIVEMETDHERHPVDPMASNGLAAASLDQAAKMAADADPDVPELDEPLSKHGRRSGATADQTEVSGGR